MNIRLSRPLRFSVSMLLVALCAQILPASAESSDGTLASVPQWSTDYEGILKLSQETGKPVLVNFTGSDWCGWCVKLKKDLFETPGFVAYSNDELLLLEVDFPSRKPIDPALAASNRKLAEAYGVEGFPTLVVLDGNGKELGRHVGYFKGGVKAFSAYIQSLLPSS